MYTHAHTHARALTRPQNQDSKDRGFDHEYDKSESTPVTTGKFHT